MVRPVLEDKGGVRLLTENRFRRLARGKGIHGDRVRSSTTRTPIFRRRPIAAYFGSRADAVRSFSSWGMSIRAQLARWDGPFRPWFPWVASS